VTVTVEHFDRWYAAMAPQSPRDRLWQEHLGLPDEMVSSSLLSLSGLREIGSLLDLGRDDVLLDLACGRGGYGMWLAREAGCRVVGVDFSAVAVADAMRRRADFALTERASYHVGELAENGLADASVDAAVCVDAIQFAADATAACHETLRVLRPGGIAVFTTWEALDRTDSALPERIRRLDLARSLREAGFVGVEVLEKPEWLTIERDLWEGLLAVDPGPDEAMQDAREEAERVSIRMLSRSRRILAVGQVPA
jgi:SAM-dependent methyltransferase